MADGPGGIRLSIFGTPEESDTDVCHEMVAYPSGTCFANTWNSDIAYEFGACVRDDLEYSNIEGWLAPGINIHRNPLNGRNFEYMSEDPLLAGKTGAYVTFGVQYDEDTNPTGRFVTIKHFACNNIEYERGVSDSVVSERALREIYLRGFEICIKESKPNTLMTSYNKINGVWSHYNYDLVTTILRKEWGYDGVVITDWWMQKSASPEFPKMKDNAYRVRAQVDVLMPGGNRAGARRPDGTLLKTYGKENGISLGELQFTAENVLHLCLKKIRHAGKETE